MWTSINRAQFVSDILWDSIFVKLSVQDEYRSFGSNVD